MIANRFQAPRPQWPDLLALHAKWQPRKPAIVTPEVALTWRQFDAACNRVANGLRDMGVGRGDMVAVMMANSADMAVVLFGCMKAGCCSVPLNLTIGDEALVAMIADCNAKALFAHEDQTVRIDKGRNQHLSVPNDNRICIGAPREGWRRYESWHSAASSSQPAITVQADDPMNVIYSSGTTGTPKGILHSFQGRLDWAYDLAVAFRYHTQTRALCTVGLYSNIMWVQMLCTALAGGTLYIHPDFDAERTLSILEDDGITHLAMVPVQFQRLVDAGLSARHAKTLQTAITVGSPMHEGLKRGLIDTLPHGLFELYGLTEGIITVMEPECIAKHPTSIGRPIQGCDIRILDDHDGEVAVGTPGEIVSRARYVMPGYLNRPDATAAAQWIDNDGKMWLRTGDIGRLDEDGYLYIVDRKKDMILSGGQNIYPADIEAELRHHEAVKDCAVIGIADSKWGETPLALVTRKAESDADEETIQRWLNNRLGKQQRVSALRFIDELPRNPNGKILKRQLRQWHEEGLI